MYMRFFIRNFVCYVRAVGKSCCHRRLIVAFAQVNVSLIFLFVDLLFHGASFCGYFTSDVPFSDPMPVVALLFTCWRLYICKVYDVSICIYDVNP